MRGIVKGDSGVTRENKGSREPEKWNCREEGVINGVEVSLGSWRSWKARGEFAQRHGRLREQEQEGG